MRVLVLASTFPRRPGDEQPAFILDFCRHLPGCDVHVLVPGAEGAAAEETIDGVHVHRFRYAPVARWQQLAYGGGMLANVRGNPLLFLLLPAFLLAMLLGAWRIVRRERIDVIHAHWIIPQGIVGALLRMRFPRTRLVVTSHGADAYAFNGKAGQALKRFILARADAVTAVSTQIARDLQAWLPAGRKPVVAPMGIDLARFDRAVAGREMQFCFVGRFVDKKGLPDLVEAYRRARGILGDALPPLALVGDGPLRATVEALIDTGGLGGQVTLRGWLPADDVATMMARSIAVLVPSVVAADGDREGLGLVAVEALAAGTPVIAYDYGAIRDVVTPGADGILVPQGDIDGLARALIKGAEGRLPVVDEQARARVRARFDWHAVGAGYQALYAGLPVEPPRA